MDSRDIERWTRQLEPYRVKALKRVLKKGSLQEAVERFTSAVPADGKTLTAKHLELREEPLEAMRAALLGHRSAAVNTHMLRERPEESLTDDERNQVREFELWCAEAQNARRALEMLSAWEVRAGMESWGRVL